MRETTVEVQAGHVRLIGTLCQPDHDGPYPAALLLSGSGPLDRDSNIPGQRLDVSKALAEGLAARAGVASLRYDKRGVGESGGDFVTATFSDETADASNALNVLRAIPETNGRVAVIGHSVGATIAMRLAVEQRASGRIRLSRRRGRARWDGHGVAVVAHRVDPPRAVAVVPWSSRAPAGA